MVKPCLASGAGSTPRLVKRSAREAKQRKAPSATCKESYQIENEKSVILLITK